METVSAVVSVMVPVAVPVATVTAGAPAGWPAGVPKVTVTVSGPSAMLSARVGTLTVALLWPARMVTLTGWPLKSSTGVAVPP